MSNITIFNGRPPFVGHNEELVKLIRSRYTLENLKELLALLSKHDVLTLKRLSSGGATAVTILDQSSLEAALGDDLVRMWTRDNGLQAFGELVASRDPELLAAVKCPPDAWRRGLLANLKHYEIFANRFKSVIKGDVPGYAENSAEHPEIRFNAFNFREVPGWRHKQNDAHGILSFLLFWTLNQSLLTWGAEDVHPLATSYTALLHAMFWHTQVWSDQDYGAWEDSKAEHFSSIAAVAVGLAEQLDFMKVHGPVEYSGYKADQNGVRELMEKCLATVKELGTNESIRPFARNADLAQLNPLVMQALSGRQVIDDETVVKILHNLEKELMQEHGFRRYVGDIWDGREFRTDLTRGRDEAGWVHGSPMMSVILGALYERTEKQEYLDWQTYHFSRALAGINQDWRTPEAYILDKTTRQWVSDANVPLAWTQAMLILAFASMKTSLNKKAQLEVAAQAAAQAAAPPTAPPAPEKAA